jgi:hypothetical protein
MEHLTLPFDEPAIPPGLDELDELIGSVEELIARYGYEEVIRVVRLLAPFDPDYTPVPSAPARHTDPETSHAAAKREKDIGRFSIKSRQAKLLALFAMQDLTHQAATIHLVGTHAVPSAFDGCRRRCSDLVAVGYIADSGRRRKNAGSDDLSIVWTITPAGRTAIQWLDTTGWSRP